MKRIAILAPYVGSINRGAETFVIELTKQLNKTYEIDVYSLKKDKSISDNMIVVDIKKNWLFCVHERFYNNNRYYRKLANKLYYLIPDVLFQKKFSKAAFSKIKLKKYDLLFPNNGVWGGVYSAKYKKDNNIPFIYTGHGGIGPGEKYTILTKPDAYICLTNKQLSWAQKINKSPRAKIFMIPNGVNTYDFKESKHKNKRKVLSVAALTAFKRHELTIKAISKIKDIELTILGKGEEEAHLKKLAEQLLPGRCRITSASYDDIKSYYSETDLFVLPSINEPFGIAYLEAMASNVPIVAPNDSSRREIIGDAGLYCDVEDLNMYADCIKDALNMHWENKPRSRAELFDWKIVGRKYKEMIEEVMSKYI